MESLSLVSRFLVKKKRIWKTKRMGNLVIIPKKWAEIFTTGCIEMIFDPTEKVIKIKPLNEVLPRKRTGFFKKEVVEI